MLTQKKKNNKMLKDHDLQQQLQDVERILFRNCCLSLSLFHIRLASSNSTGTFEVSFSKTLKKKKEQEKKEKKLFASWEKKISRENNSLPLSEK
jgi:hypothetical protein